MCRSSLQHTPVSLSTLWPPPCATNKTARQHFAIESDRFCRLLPVFFEQFYIYIIFSRLSAILDISQLTDSLFTLFSSARPTVLLIFWQRQLKCSWWMKRLITCKKILLLLLTHPLSLLLIVKSALLGFWRDWLIFVFFSWILINVLLELHVLSEYKFKN